VAILNGSFGTTRHGSGPRVGLDIACETMERRVLGLHRWNEPVAAPLTLSMRSTMSINQFLDRYIQGEPGYYYFQIELIWGREISGGQFHRKQDARNSLLSKLISFLDDPNVLLSTKEKKNEI
jgi:hypothetical protein